MSICVLATLPLAPTIPPPPLDDGPGPAVPPRGNLHMLAAQAAGRLPYTADTQNTHGNTYKENHCDINLKCI